MVIFRKYSWDKKPEVMGNRKYINHHDVLNVMKWKCSNTFGKAFETARRDFCDG